eukprot:c19644_g1_i1 orf=113-421(+)
MVLEREIEQSQANGGHLPADDSDKLKKKGKRKEKQRNAHHSNGNVSENGAQDVYGGHPDASDQSPTLKKKEKKGSNLQQNEVLQKSLVETEDTAGHLDASSR